MRIGIKRAAYESIENGKPVTYEYALWCNESKGPWVEHWHDSDGHVFPVKRRDLINLKRRIEEMLEPRP